MKKTLLEMIKKIISDADERELRLIYIFAKGLTQQVKSKRPNLT